ncbi:U1 zinc finger [Geosmithia morbida]|uniref:U1 zinc finger n=1 Tax=Geosmithia morbida TaxID=1094350 RepID=A0A9P4YU16_9HYPO|nr:U1 zinc finger [Geosmithia morbida]KAF4122065.1 U1 zinc finger [Geosmithia morbida]
MSEHWKSTPRYWCKHCACYVRDTKLERQNHEATGRHQGNLKRFLRELHRGHEREEREKERARQEIERVNGIVSGSGSGSGAGPSSKTSFSFSTKSSPSGTGAGAGAPRADDAQLRKQREQLAEMGVAMPSELRPEMALVGEWQVMSTRVIRDDDRDNKEKLATGVRKREATEDQKEEEDAVRSLFKKPRRWGRDSKSVPQDEDAELDALLNGSVFTKSDGADSAGEVKREEGKKEEEDKVPAIKEEVDDENIQLPVSEAAKAEDAATSGGKVKPEESAPAAKKEVDDESILATEAVKAEVPVINGHFKSEESAPASATPSAPPLIAFKKRKAKGTMRQK